MSESDEDKSKAVLKYSPIQFTLLNVNSDAEDRSKVDSDDEVHSTAVVKYSNTYPVSFRQLALNTNLNLPPLNWMCTSVSPGFKNVLHDVLYGKNEDNFRSFRIAHMFAEYVGEVDIVADAEVIKNILKIPYHNGPVSVLVNRIANTLLIDNFDVKKFLIQISEREDYKELRQFLCTILKTNLFDNSRYIRSRSRKKLQERSLVSKFLCYSVEPSNGNVDSSSKFYGGIEKPVSTSSPEETADPYADIHQHNRNVYWTFESLRMLIGTDMPIFGQGIHPCISLRLHDINKPISVLTGIDYWLDNLMSNVPEVAMCYHLNGVVQKYELIKTEDLPKLENSQFSAALIKDIAKSILSFLKSNATKAGHTYWLFKPNNEEVVKLYDLTSLCSKNLSEKDESPFVVPVAMLLYRVARSMKYSSNKQKPSVIRMLLEHCVDLLDKKKYPEVVTSSHYLLSDLYIPLSTNPEVPLFDKEDDDNINYDDDGLSSEETVVSIEKDHAKNFEAPPIPDAVKERALLALRHVAAGLDSLRYFKNVSSFARERQKASSKDDEIPMANSSIPIPMPYRETNLTVIPDNIPEDTIVKLNGKKGKKKRNNKRVEAIGDSQIRNDESLNAVLLKIENKTQQLPTWQDFKGDRESWERHLKMCFYEKAELVYAILSEQYFEMRDYGSTLKNLCLLLRCSQIKNVLCNESNLLIGSLFTRAADCYSMIIQNWEQVPDYHKSYETIFEHDKAILKQLCDDEQLYDINYNDTNLQLLFISNFSNAQQIITKSINLYKAAVQYDSNAKIWSKLANAYNELGQYLLREIRANRVPSKTFKKSTHQSLENFKKALQIFDDQKDKINKAVVYNNIGHYYRFMAHVEIPNSNTRHIVTALERNFYDEALSNYRLALALFEGRTEAPDVWDTVSWELSTTSFVLAMAMFGSVEFYAVPEKIKIIEETIELLKRSISDCDLQENHSKFPLYQFRVGLIFSTLGVCYYTLLRIGAGPLQKNSINALSYYEQGAAYFVAIPDTSNYFSVQKQRVSVIEEAVKGVEIPIKKIELYECAISVCLESTVMLKLIVDNKADIDECSESLIIDISTLVEKLRQLLLESLKLIKSTATLQKRYDADVFKRCYGRSLKQFDVTCALKATKGFLDMLVDIEREYNLLKKKR